MAWDAASFKVRWPEFIPTADAVVTATLADAVLRVDDRLFGDSTDAAVGLLTAHLLAISPFGQQNRMVSDDGDTTYNREFKRMSKNATGGPWRTGQGPTGLL